MSEFTPKHLETMFGGLQDCCLHKPTWTPVDAERVLCSVWSGDGSGGWQDCAVPDEWGDFKGGTESTSYTVVLLKDGRYGLLAESEDYTGHGCQCDASASTYASLDELLRLGVEEWQSGARDAIRARLGGSS